MAICVKIRKHAEKNNIVYYAVFKQDYETTEFYMGIDEKAQLLLFYITDNFKHPIKIIDFKKKDEIINKLDNIPDISFFHAVMRGLKALNINTYPQILDYEA